MKYKVIWTFLLLYLLQNVHSQTRFNTTGPWTDFQLLGYGIKARCMCPSPQSSQYRAQFQNPNNYPVEFEYIATSSTQNHRSRLSLPANGTSNAIVIPIMACGNQRSDDLFLSIVLLSSVPVIVDRNPVVSVNDQQQPMIILFARNTWSTPLNVTNLVGCATKSILARDDKAVKFLYRLTNLSSSRLYLRYTVTTQNCGNAASKDYELILLPNAVSPELIVDTDCDVQQGQTILTFKQIQNL